MENFVHSGKNASDLKDNEKKRQHDNRADLRKIYYDHLCAIQ